MLGGQALNSEIEGGSELHSGYFITNRAVDCLGFRFKRTDSANNFKAFRCFGP